MCETKTIKRGRTAKPVDALMCQNCGAVMIASYDRMRSHNKIGFSYCDKECMYQDRGRVYKTSEAYQQKVNAAYAVRYGKQTWENDVCKVFFPTCRICSALVSTRSIKARAICSAKCSRIDIARKAKIKKRLITQSPKETHCAECEVWFTALVRTKCDRHYCSSTCRDRYLAKLAKHRRRERCIVPNGMIRGSVSLKAQYRKYKGKCQLCGCSTQLLKDFAEHQATVDHIVPLSKGGLHVEENLQLACMACNSNKSDSLADGRQMLLY